MSNQTDRVVKAWTDKGTHPRYHDQQKLELLHTWPALHDALVALAKAHPEDPSLPTREQIAEAVERAGDAYRLSDNPERFSFIVADAVLALLQKGADR